MAASSRGGSRAGQPGSGNRNSNREGRNQYSGVRGSQLATAAALGGAVAAGVFLWSRRNQRSEQFGNLTDQIGDWRGRLSTGDNFAEGDASGQSLAGSSQAENGSGRTQVEIAQEALTLKQLGETA